MVESGAATISVAEFLSVCIYLSEECGKVIRQVEESGDLKTQEKGKDGPVTVADLRVQKTLEVCLKALYPTLDVQGEESKESIADVEPAVDPATITDALKDFITTDYLRSQQERRAAFITDVLRQHYGEDEVDAASFETFSTENATVWIDPLDGTSDFVKGNLPAVTVIIGLSLGGKSRAGVIHNVYQEEDRSVGQTFFATAEHGCFRVPYEKTMDEAALVARELEYFEPFDQAEPEEGHAIKVAASLSHFSATIQEIIETIDPVEIVRLGGAGNKCANVARGTVDSYIHPSPGLKNWDLCAPESMIKAMGGWATNLYQERLTYPAGGNPNIKGLILGKSPAMYGLITRRMGELLTTIGQKVKL